MNARAIATRGPGRRRYQRCLAALAVLAVGLGALQVIAAGPVSAAPGDITEFALPPGSGPDGITTGPDGNLWFTASSGRVGRITPTGTITEYAAGITTEPGQRGITTGPDGNLWFTEASRDRIGRITPDGTVTEYATGITAGSSPFGIATGPDGNLWFTENGGHRIGRITPTGTVTEYTTGITPGSGPYLITEGPDGNLWFTENRGDRIGRITPDGTVTEFGIGTSARATPVGITSGPDGNLWFTESNGGRIGQITPTGTVTQFGTGISAGSTPDGITSGPDGNLWFTEFNSDRIGRITPDGILTEYSTGIPTGSNPRGISSGPDGNIWFTESGRDRIVRLELAPVAALDPASHDFGEQPLGSAGGPQQFTLTNNGAKQVTVGDVSVSGADPGDFAISDDHCSGAAVGSGHHRACTISVTFTPAAIGARSATLSIPDNAAGSPHTATLTGIGARAASTVQLTSTPNPSTFGDPVSLTAHVSTTAPVAPTGSVTFTDGATSLGTVEVDGTGTATLTTSALHGGQRQITATYSGDTNLTGSSTTTGQQVNAAATTLTARPAQLVVQLPGTSGLRLSARLAVTSTGTPIAGQPVAMRVNGTTACTATTATDGLATCIAPLIYLLGVTLHGYTATYPGSPDYQPATGHAGLLG